jgi:hypothetical protein
MDVSAPHLRPLAFGPCRPLLLLRLFMLLRTLALSARPPVLALRPAGASAGSLRSELPLARPRLDGVEAREDAELDEEEDLRVAMAECSLWAPAESTGAGLHWRAGYAFRAVGAACARP